jgi:hypothetical protein
MSAPNNIQQKKNKEIPAILLLAGQKTYGRTKSKVPIYKCVPNDPELLPMLVPYKMKSVGFTKVFSNLYVLIRIENQEDEKKEEEGTLARDKGTQMRDKGILSNVIGPTDDVNAFYEYQIICKNLNISLTALTKTLIRQKITPELIVNDAWIAKYQIQNALKKDVYTIDPAGCKDFDDAFSVYKTDNGETILTIYIANVPVILDTLNLWNQLSERVATIYLPNTKRPMLPPILSEGLCSLKAGQDRVTFAMEFSLSVCGVMTYLTHYNCLVNVRRNFVYEEKALLQNEDYQLLKRMFSNCDNSHGADCLTANSQTVDSHTIVESMMIGMNAQSAALLIQKQCGIFRTVTKKEETEITNEMSAPYDQKDSQGESDAIQKHIYNWKCMHGQYVMFNSSDTTSFHHATLNLDAYAHVTSPIRRLVDVVNMSMLCLDNMPFLFGEGCTAAWLNQLNEQMTAIRRVQNTCNLLDTITNTPFITEEEFDGHVFDENMVYIPKLNLTTKFTAPIEKQQIESGKLSAENNGKFRLFLFSDEHALYKKVRIMRI